VIEPPQAPATASYVLDTSVAVAWYLPEAFSDAARAWQRRFIDGEIRLLVPSFHYWEVANVLRTYVRRGEVAATVAQETYRLHLLAPLSVIDPDRERVLDLALTLDATAYDSVYIALAVTLDLPLLTAERQTKPWVAHLEKRGRLVAVGGTGETRAQVSPESGL
jgi:predicted nucleic acid-binding protein